MAQGASVFYWPRHCWLGYSVVLLWYGGEPHDAIVLLLVAVWVAQFAVVELVVGAGGLTVRMTSALN